MDIIFAIFTPMLQIYLKTKLQVVILKYFAALPFTRYTVFENKVNCIQKSITIACTRLKNKVIHNGREISKYFYKNNFSVQSVVVNL
jgi:hypothetical protein